jgi:hypothetical protein
MLRRILQILPVLLYKRLALRSCEIVNLGGVLYVTAAQDVLVRLSPPPASLPEE